MDFEQTILVPQLDSATASLYELRTPIIQVENTQESKSTKIELGVYDNLVWDSSSAHEVLEDADSWGTKTLPGAGPFYFANFEGEEPILDHLPTK